MLVSLNGYPISLVPVLVSLNGYLISLVPVLISLKGWAPVIVSLWRYPKYVRTDGFTIL